MNRTGSPLYAERYIGFNWVELGAERPRSSKLPFKWDGWQSLDRAIDAPARQDVLVRGWGSRDCTEWLFGFSTKSDTVLLRLVSALLKDVDYLPMAKPVRN